MPNKVGQGCTMDSQDRFPSGAFPGLSTTLATTQVQGLRALFSPSVGHFHLAPFPHSLSGQNQPGFASSVTFDTCSLPYTTRSFRQLLIVFDIALTTLFQSFKVFTFASISTKHIR